MISAIPLKAVMVPIVAMKEGMPVVLTMIPLSIPIAVPPMRVTITATGIGHPIEMDENLFRKQLEQLDAAARSEISADEMKRLVAEVVPTYHPDL